MPRRAPQTSRQSRHVCFAGVVAVGVAGAALLPLRPVAAQAPAGPCAAGTLADYLALGPGGCVVAVPGAGPGGAPGGVLFAGFTSSLVSRTQSVVQVNPFAPGDVRITPVVATVAGASYAGLRVDPTISFAASSANALPLGSTCAGGLACYRDERSVQLLFRFAALPGAAVSSLFLTDFAEGGVAGSAATAGNWDAQALAALQLPSSLVPPDAAGPGVVLGARSVRGATTEQCVRGLERVPCAAVGPYAFTPGPNADRVAFNLIALARTADVTAPPAGFGAADAPGATLLFGVGSAATVVPEPTTVTLTAVGLLSLALARTRRRTSRG